MAKVTYGGCQVNIILHNLEYTRIGKECFKKKIIFMPTISLYFRKIYGSLIEEKEIRDVQACFGLLMALMVHLCFYTDHLIISLLWKEHAMDITLPPCTSIVKGRILFKISENILLNSDNVQGIQGSNKGWNQVLLINVSFNYLII